MRRQKISYHIRKTEQYKRLVLLTMFFRLHSLYRVKNNFKEMILNNPAKNIDKVSQFMNDFNNMFGVEKKLEDFIASDDKIMNMTIDVHDSYKETLENLSDITGFDEKNIENCIVAFDNLKDKGKNFRVYKKITYIFFHVYLSQFLYYMDGDYDSDKLSIGNIDIDDVNIYIPNCVARELCRIAEDHIYIYLGE